MELFDLYLSLFLQFFKIGLFGFGGAYAMLPLIQQEVVETHHWLSIYEFADIVAIAQTAPGPIAVNMATHVGYTAVTNMGFSPVQGAIGSAVATLAVSSPSIMIMTAVCAFFVRLKDNPWIQSSLSILKPATIGLIAAAALLLMNETIFIDYRSWIIFGVVFVASMRKVNPILLIVLAGVAGLIFL
ncbi:MAG: chromate transporter [Dysgonamonadaceae bacterium]|jgi:chromate transporter|nr:chromate transporter [Dysgonamonadaceae bacterium]